AQVTEVEKLLSNQREHAEAVDRLLDEKAFALSADPRESSGAPERESVAPPIDFTPLEKAAQRLKASAEAYDLAAARAQGYDPAGHIGPILQQVEQALIDRRGLPGRPWYRH